VPTLSKQSTAEYGRRLCLFYPSNKLTFDILTLKVMSESRVTWATSVPILVFPRLSVLDLRPMYATDRQTDVRQTSDAHHRLMPPPYRGGAIITCHADKFLSFWVVPAVPQLIQFMPKCAHFIYLHLYLSIAQPIALG